MDVFVGLGVCSCCWLVFFMCVRALGLLRCIEFRFSYGRVFYISKVYCVLVMFQHAELQ